MSTIAVRLPNWLGDTVMAVPALRALAVAHPDARVVVAGPWAPLLAHQGIAELCVEYPRSWAGRLRTADTVAALRPDVAVTLPNSLEAALSARYWGAARRIGFDTQGRGVLLTDRVPVPSPRRHQIEEYLLLVAPLGAQAAPRAPSLSVAAMGEGAARGRALLEASVGVGPRVGVHLGAAFGPSKLWPTERLGALCAALVERGVATVLLGAPSDEEVARDVQARVPQPVPSLIGRDSPEMMPGVLAGVSVLVSGDTGTAHLAAALGVRTITLFGPTDPSLSAPRGNCEVLVGAAPCAPCFYKRCPIDHVCMRNIGVERVLSAVLGQLGCGGSERGGLIEMGGSVLPLLPHAPPPLRAPDSGVDALSDSRDLSAPGRQAMLGQGLPGTASRGPA